MTSADSPRRDVRLHIAVIALAVDLAMIVLFAAMGRASHDEGSAVGGTLLVAAPFLIGYVVAAAVTRLDRTPLSITRAALTWFPAIVLGMLLRRFVFDRGTAVAFVIVAFVTTGVLIVGWRCLVALIRASRTA